MSFLEIPSSQVHHIASGIIHLSSGIALVIVASQDEYKKIVELDPSGEIEPAWFAAVSSWWSAFVHIVIRIWLYPFEPELYSWSRYLDYTVSASLMVVPIGLLGGQRNVTVLILSTFWMCLTMIGANYTEKFYFMANNVKVKYNRGLFLFIMSLISYVLLWVLLFTVGTTTEANVAATLITVTVHAMCAIPMTCALFAFPSDITGFNAMNSALSSLSKITLHWTVVLANFGKNEKIAHVILPFLIGVVCFIVVMVSNYFATKGTTNRIQAFRTGPLNERLT